jgi:hypothetical protein
MIKANRETHFPAYVNDYLPTFLDVIGMAHPHPTWAADGISLMPLIRRDFLCVKGCPAPPVGGAADGSMRCVVPADTEPLGAEPRGGQPHQAAGFQAGEAGASLHPVSTPSQQP